MTTKNKYLENCGNGFMTMIKVIESLNWAYYGEYPYQQGQYGFRVANKRSTVYGANDGTWQAIKKKLVEQLGHHIVSFGAGHSQYAPEQARFAVFIKSKAQASREYNLLKHINRLIAN
jgi:hypothetical protein